MNYLQLAFVGLLPIIVLGMWIVYMVWLIGGATKQFFVYFLTYVDAFGLDHPLNAVKTAWRTYQDNRALKVVYDDLLVIRALIHEQLDANEKSLDSSPELEIRLLGELSRVEAALTRAWDARTGKTDEVTK
jgi:hypothetical protein